MADRPGIMIYFDMVGPLKRLDHLVAETTDISVEELCLKILDKWASKK